MTHCYNININKLILFLFIFTTSFFFSQEYSISGSVKIYSNYTETGEIFLDVDSTQINKKEFRISYDTDVLGIEINNDFSFDIELSSLEINQNTLYPATIYIKNSKKDNVLNLNATICCVKRKNFETFETFEKNTEKIIFTFFESGIKPYKRIIIELNKIKP